MALGVRFRDFVPDENSGDKGFEQLFKLFMQLITITSGDVGEALQWLNELDKQYGLTDDEYGMGNFIEDLKKKGYMRQNYGSIVAFELSLGLIHESPSILRFKPSFFGFALNQLPWPVKQVKRARMLFYQRFLRRT